MVSNPKEDISKEGKKVFDRKGKCKWCGSDRVVKNGKKKDGQQNYLCKDCNHQFIDNGNFPRMRKPKKVIAIGLELYFNGVSFPKTSKMLKKIYGEKVNQKTIQRWIEKYAPEIEKYLTNFEPQLSGKWQADETCLKFRPEAPLTPEQRAKRVRRKGDIWWHWDVIDEGTRFIVATHISKARSIKEGLKFFKKTKYASRPKRIITDGCFSYDKAIRKIYYSRSLDRRVDHKNIEHVSENGKIERWHGNLKDRTGSMRGLKSPESKIPMGFAIHHNYLTEHGKLNGMTPAQASGINLPFTDGWGDLIDWATFHQNGCTVKPEEVGSNVPIWKQNEEEHKFCSEREWRKLNDWDIIL